MIFKLLMLIYFSFLQYIQQSSIDRNYDLLIQLRKDNTELRSELVQLKIMLMSQEKVLESFVIEEGDKTEYNLGDC